MSEPSKTPVSEQIEAFTKRIEELRQQHQQIALALCMARMARDAGMLSEQPRPRPQGLAGFGDWMLDQIAALFEWPSTKNRSSPGEATVVVIDGRKTYANGKEVIDVTPRTR
jgi:hypothetical protein